MRSAMALLAIAAAAALGGCAAQDERLSWFFSEDRQEGAKLVLGVPDTDDLRLLALCQPHSGEVRLAVFGRQGDPAVVELHSGKLWSRYVGAGIAEDEESLGALDIQVRLRADDPVLARVADTGELTVVLGKRRMVLPNSFAQAHDFLAVCRQ
ncbi:MAG TPA: hypothetical protein VFE10_14645 [Phenylobacterium sp.]|jgi:hypothetical protein|nr:hypothetical protein [Phenylobacterium sp.]